MMLAGHSLKRFELLRITCPAGLGISLRTASMK